MFVERHTLEITTDGSGDAEAFTPNVSGRILAIIYVKDDFAAGVDFDVTLEATGEVIWDEDDVNASSIVYPRVGVHDTDGTARTYDATQTVGEPLVAGNDRVKVVVGSGGNTKSGTFHILVG